MHRRRAPEPAPAAQQLLATAIDTATWLGVIAAGVFVAARRAGRRGNTDGATLRRRADWIQRPAARNAFRVLGLAVVLGQRTHRSPGQRIVGLRLVDGRTGETPTVAAVMRHWAFDTARGRLVSEGLKRLTRRSSPTHGDRPKPDDPELVVAPSHVLLLIALTAGALVVARRRRAAGHPPARVLIRDR